MSRATIRKAATGAGIRVLLGIPAALLIVTGCATVAAPVGETVEAPSGLHAQPQEAADLLPIFADAEVRYDDRIGFEEYFILLSDEEVATVAGTIRRQFCRPEEGRSPLEIIRFYQQTIEDLGGTILYQTRDARSVEVDGETLVTYFRKERLERGLSTYVWDHTQFPGRAMSEYLSAIVPVGDGEAYVVVAAGRPDREVPEFRGARFELVTVDL